MKITKMLLCMVSAVASIVSSGCDAPKPKATIAKSTEPLIVSTHKGYYSALIWLAKNRGYFSQHGVNVQLQTEESGVTSLSRLYSGEADLATIAEFAFVSQSSQHPDLRILAVLAEVDSMKIVARRDHGVSQISDLKNKRIGLVRGSVADYCLHLLLMFHQIPEQDVQVVDLSPSGQMNALTKGEIDAAIVWWPFTAQMEDRLGTRAISWSAQKGQDFYWLLVGKDDTLKKRPADMQRVLAALAAAEDFMNSHPDEAKRIVASEIGLNVTPELWESSKYRLSLDRPFVLAMEAQLRWIKAEQDRQEFKMPNLLDYIHFDALKSLDPEKVQMGH